jgi:predicted cupin superfamily sugar epimerase
MTPRAPGRVAELVRALALRPHPEGGHFAEVYRSPRLVRPAGRAVERSALTTIYFLLAAGEHSRWHRVLADEVWHFYEGEPLELLWMPSPDGAVERRRLGATGDARRVAVVPAGAWQAARPLGAHALVGCTVGPGFDFADFALLADHPEPAAALRQLAPDLARLR